MADPNHIGKHDEDKLNKELLINIKNEESRCEDVIVDSKEIRDKSWIKDEGSVHLDKQGDAEDAENLKSDKSYECDLTEGCACAAIKTKQEIEKFETESMSVTYEINEITDESDSAENQIQMVPKKRSSDSKNDCIPKKHRTTISLQKKMDILKRLTGGEKAVTISRAMGIPATTIRTIKQNEEKIRSSAAESSETSLPATTKTRSHTMEKMEKLLLVWIGDLKKKKSPLSKAIVQNKARSIYEDIKQINGNEDNFKFSASNGWFENFKKRTKLHSIKFTEVAASEDKEAAENFPNILKDIIAEGGYSPNQIFNVDETGLTWKHMGSRKYLFAEKTPVPGFKVSKERLTLLLGGNAAGDFKLKPLLVYKSQNPRALKDIPIESLPVIWTSNANVLVTADVFVEWFNSYFCPKVKDYCHKNNLAQKALLLLNSTAGHLINLNEASDGIRVIFLPPNTTALLQPMDQGVKATFKDYYLRHTLNQLTQQIDKGDDNTVQHFWKQYTILDALKNIEKSWNGIDESSMKSAWKKVIPETENEIKDFLSSNEESLSTEQPRDQEKFNNENAGALHSEAVEKRCTLTLKKMSEAFSLFDKALNILESCDPDRERYEFFSEGVKNSIGVYIDIFKEKQRTSLNQPRMSRHFGTCLSKQSAVETEVDPELSLLQSKKIN